MQIYAYYVMSSRKFSDVFVCTSYSPQRLSSCIFKNEIFYNVGLLVFGKVEGILIIPLEKWKFVHKLR